MVYMGSKSKIAKDLVPILQKYIDEYNIKNYIEPFCLAKDQVVYTENGIKNVGDINVGDVIYDDNCQLSKVINKVKSPNKKGKKIILKGNVEIKATDNHIFYLGNGQEIKVDDLKIGDNLLFGSQKSINPVIDLGNYIIVSNVKQYGRSGYVVDDKHVRLYHNAPITNRIISITKELMHCYGMVVANGDKSNLTIHKDEIGFLKEFVENYENILDIKDNNIKYDYRNNVCRLSVPYKTIYEKLFFEVMNIGYGARNKNISFLFKCTPEMCLEAIRYMFVVDGSLRNKCEGKYRSLNYKTSSRTLAYQLQALLAIKFGIKSTLSYAMNKQKDINGRLLKESDYYNISITQNEDIEFITGIVNNKQIHEKIKGFVITEIIEIEDEFYDITLDNSSHRFIIDGGIVTHNCGGANVIDKIKCEFKYASDKQRYLIALYQNLDKLDTLPETISKEHYVNVRDCYNKKTDDFEDWYIGAVGFLSSYNGRFFDGGYSGIVKSKSGHVRNYYDECRRNLKKQKENLKDIYFICCDYREIGDVEDSLIYCDPPYKNTKKYLSSKGFNHDDFWQWVRDMSIKNIVLVSELEAPDDFECIWEQEIKRNIEYSKSILVTEKLFRYKGRE